MDENQSTKVEYGNAWEQAAIRSVETTHDAMIKGNRILTLNGDDTKFQRQNDIGIKKWGMIDGLVRFHGFFHFHVANFSGKG